MPKMQFQFTLDDIVTAVVPAVEKALQPKFDSLEERLMAHTTKTVDNVFNELAAMTAKDFGHVHKEINALAWKLEILA